MEIKVFPDIVLITFVFASCRRNQIVTWRFKCFKTSRKQLFTLVSVGVEGLYEDYSVSRSRANNNFFSLVVIEIKALGLYED